MRYIIFTILFFASAIFAIEGIDPPRHPVQVDVQLDEDKNALPSDFVELFEEPYRYFLAYNPESLLTMGDIRLGKFGIAGNLGLNSADGNFSAFGSLDTIWHKKYRAFANGDYSYKIADLVPIKIDFSSNYSKKEFHYFDYGFFFPKFYSAKLNGSAYYPWGSGLAAIHIYSDGFLAKDFPVDKLGTDKYQEFCVSAFGRGYQFITKRFGVYAEGGYHLARRGIDLLPQRARSTSVGGFVEYSPFIARVGLSYSFINDLYLKKIRPAVSARWLGYPYIAEIHYGVGIRTNPVADYLFDENIEKYNLCPALIETIGVKISYKSENITITGGGTYGKSSSFPYMNVSWETPRAIKNSEATISQAYIRFDANKIFHNTDKNIILDNSLTAFLDYSKLPDNHLIPFKNKYIAVDTLYLKFSKFFGSWISGEYHSGYYHNDQWYSWSDGDIVAYSIGSEFRWKFLTAKIWYDEISKPLVVEPPYFIEKTGGYKISLGFEKSF